jgi:PhzF family phenazine biosynthesis protein
MRSNIQHKEKKMEIPLYQIDAFASELFTGNPAAVCPLNDWPTDALMQSIAAENNLSETAFCVPEGHDSYRIRWFTPVSEVDLCGHATLATAYVLFHLLGYDKDKITFYSRSGVLSVSRDDDWLTLDFPAQPPVACDIPETIVKAFGAMPMACLQSEDLMVVFEHESDVKVAAPDFAKLMQIESRGIIITAASRQWDFVARFFAPRYGIPEDPVTGSAYTQLVPYWASRTGKKRFRAKQVSARGGELTCELAGDRVFISGKATRYLSGTIQI